MPTTPWRVESSDGMIVDCWSGVTQAEAETLAQGLARKINAADEMATMIFEAISDLMDLNNRTVCVRLWLWALSRHSSRRGTAVNRTKLITISTTVYADLLDWCHRHGDKTPDEGAEDLLQRILEEEYSRDAEEQEQGRLQA